MHYKIKASDQALYQQALDLVEANSEVILTHSKRLFFTAELSESLKKQLESLGAVVTTDQQYQLDTVRV